MIYDMLPICGYNVSKIITLQEHLALLPFLMIKAISGVLSLLVTPYGQQATKIFLLPI